MGIIFAVTPAGSPGAALFRRRIPALVTLAAANWIVGLFAVPRVAGSFPLLDRRLSQARDCHLSILIDLIVLNCAS